MNSELFKVAFYDDELLVIERAGKPWVLLIPVCEALGLDPQAQRRRIERSVWSREHCGFMAAPSGRGEQETFCIDLDIVSMWLATISTTRISGAAVRANLGRYQDEAADVIRDAVGLLRARPQAPQLKLVTPPKGSGR
jgi:hypothetical protein